jgi:lipoprotein Spr
MHLTRYYDRRTESLLFACLLSLIFASCGTQHRTASTHQDPKVAQKDHETRGKDNHAAASLGYYRQKFAPLIGVPASQINNVQLYSFIDSWMYAPYRYGGNSKQGVDCSNLSALLFREVYDKNISGSSATIYKETIPISKSDLQEGDCVFFKINTENISHMGVYLANHKFVHATTKAGVIISDLDEPYYRKYFFAAGRVGRSE